MSSDGSDDGQSADDGVPYGAGCLDWRATESYRHISWTDLPAFTSRYGMFSSSPDSFQEQQEPHTNKAGVSTEAVESVAGRSVSSPQVQLAKSVLATPSNKRKRTPHSLSTSQARNRAPALSAVGFEPSSQHSTEYADHVGEEVRQYSDQEEEMRQTYSKIQCLGINTRRGYSRIESPLSWNNGPSTSPPQTYKDKTSRVGTNQEQESVHLFSAVVPQHETSILSCDGALINSHDKHTIATKPHILQPDPKTVLKTSLTSTPTTARNSEPPSQTPRPSMIPRLRSLRHLSLTPECADTNDSAELTKNTPHACSARPSWQTTEHITRAEDNDQDEDRPLEVTHDTSRVESRSPEVRGSPSRFSDAAAAILQPRNKKRPGERSDRADSHSDYEPSDEDDLGYVSDHRPTLQLYGIVNPTPAGFVKDYWLSRSHSQQLAIEAALEEDRERAYQTYCVGLVDDLQEQYAPHVPKSTVFPPTGFRNDYWMVLNRSQRGHIREGLKVNADREYAKHVAGLTDEYKQQYRDGHAHGNTKPPAGFLASYWKTLSRLERSHVRDAIKASPAREYAKHILGLTPEYQRRYEGGMNHGNLRPPRGFTVKYWSMLTANQRNAIRSRLKTNPTGTYQTHLKGLTLEYQHEYAVQERPPPEFRETYWQTLTEPEKKKVRKALKANRPQILFEHLSGLLRNGSGQLVRKIRDGVYKRYELSNVDSDDAPTYGDDNIPVTNTHDSRVVAGEVDSEDDGVSSDLYVPDSILADEENRVDQSEIQMSEDESDRNSSEGKDTHSSLEEDEAEDIIFDA